MTTEHTRTIRTVVGTGEAGYTGDGGLATEATLREPFLCAFDPAGNLFFCEAATTSCGAWTPPAASLPR